MNNVLVVCLGNICRSPMAEALLRNQLKETKPEVKISSAGITALINQPAAKLAQEIMLANSGIDISSHRARQITHDILSVSDLILVMDNDQQKQIEYNFPSIYGRVHRLGKWSGFDIPDPYRRSQQFFEQTYVLIDQCIKDWQIRLWK